MIKQLGKGFHQYLDEQVAIYNLEWNRTTTRQRSVAYRFSPHFHPYVARLVHELVEGSVRGLQAIDTTYVEQADGTVVTLPDGRPRPVLHEELFTPASYQPGAIVQQPYPVKELDFSSAGGYSGYNWELFYHVPLTIAIHLSRNQRFEDAQRWFHYVFDPTDDSAGPSPERFWKVKPFRTTDVKLIEEVLVNLATGQDDQLRQETIRSIEAWKDDPFRPHLVARYRPSAYMLKAVMAYLDNLIAWGDSLFRQDSGESINEATQVYVLAANILGPRPQAVPRKGWQRAQSYRSLRADLDAMSNAIREVEADIPFDLAPPPTSVADDGALATLRSLGAALYFSIPRNDKLIGYWDTVADRLFKIRNSLNIAGVFRQLPLFEPPIDPALLAKAAAAGLDVGAVAAGLNQPLPLVRFPSLVQRAAEICQEVKSLGGQLLSAIEKEDGEALAALRAKHERVLVGLTETVRYQQWQESVKAREGLEKSLTNAVGRYVYYERLLGRQPAEITVPQLDPLDTDGLARMRFRAAEPEVAPRDIGVDIADDPTGVAGGRLLNTQELQELVGLQAARDLQNMAADVDRLGGVLGLIPTFGVSAEPLGVGGTVSFGGGNLAAVFTLMSSAIKVAADQATYAAGKAAKLAGYARREQDWAHQSNLAAGEITQTFKQLRAAQIREAIAEREWHNHQQQVKHAEEIERFLTDERTGKITQKAFYSYLRREVRGLYSRCFDLAFDVARKAERALQHELGEPDRSFLEFGYQSGREGLLAGERLYLDVKRMELAYTELNRREYELTRHVSLRQVDPRALVELRATGRCTVTLPEELYDLDCPGHYFRRLRSVAVSIPCVVGPYASLNCTLTLLRSTIRTSPAIGEDGYPRNGEDAGRFSDHFGGVESVVTSTGTEDAGLFEANLRDERYLPFEYAGAVSQWRLELPADVPQFDHDTIADVVLHVRYTAREGGQPLRTAAVAALRAQVAAAASVGSTRLVSIRSEFPTEWSRFKATMLDGDTTEAPLRLTLRDEHYPYWTRTLPAIALRGVELFAQPGAATPDPVTVADAPAGDPQRVSDALDRVPELGDLRVGDLSEPLPAAVGELTLYFDDNSMEDLWLALTWGAPPA
jgi:hypothetical protein